MLEELLSGTDVVVGSRYIEGGSAGKWIACAAAILGLRQKRRISSSIKLKIRCRGIFGLAQGLFRNQRQLNGGGFKILLEILTGFMHSRVKEIPYTFRPRTSGESKTTGKVCCCTPSKCGGCVAQAALPVRFFEICRRGELRSRCQLAVMALLLAPN